MNSYNVSEAKRMTGEIEAATSAVKGAIEGGWGEFKNTFRANWVGVDENAFEGKMAQELNKVYSNCNTLGNTACSFLIAAAQAYNEFQSGLSQGMDGAAAATIADYTASTTEVTLDLPIEQQTFSETDQMGLTTSNSAAALEGQIDTYVSTITEAVNQAYEKVSVGTAFQSADGDMGISKFIDSVKISVGELVNVVSNFKENTLKELVDAYNRQSTQISEEATHATNDINSRVAGATSAN